MTGADGGPVTEQEFALGGTTPVDDIMTRREAVWRPAGVVLGLGIYWVLYPSGLSRPLWVIYDIAGVAVTCGLAGAILGRVIARDRRAGDVWRVAALLGATVVALGVEYAAWPFSGHLTCAWTAGMIELGDTRNPVGMRVAAALPGVALILIRTLQPQIPQMGIHLYTLTALLLGSALGGTAAVAARLEGAPDE